MSHDIEAIRQSPRQYVDLETVEALSDRVMVLEQQLAESESWKTLLSQMRRIDHLAKQLAKREKQVVMLREALEVCHGVTGYEFKLRKEALAATDDLSGCILCDAKPAMRVEKNASSQIRAVDGDGNAFDLLTNVGVTFYKAKD